MGVTQFMNFVIELIKKGSFYIAPFPVRWTAQSALHSTPGTPVHSDTNLASPGSILATQQLCAKTKSLAVYGAIQVLRNAVGGGGGCQLSQKKALRRCTVQCY